MSILKIARMGHPILRQQAKPIDPQEITGPEVQLLIRDMLETLVEYNGVGLAAPQVHVSRRLVICAGEEDEEGRMQVRVLINPKLTPTTEETFGMYEGCLSLPGLRGYVERPAAVTVEAFNEKGEQVTYELSGFPAAVIQHECDHLDGVLYVDRLQDTKLFAYEEEAGRFLPVDHMGAAAEVEEGAS
jgi:peptide deformylase